MSSTAIWVAVWALIIAAYVVIIRRFPDALKRADGMTSPPANHPARKRQRGCHCGHCVTPVPGPGPDDGEPLTFEEKRRLSQVDMDSLIDIADPHQDRRGENR